MLRFANFILGFHLIKCWETNCLPRVGLLWRLSRGEGAGCLRKFRADYISAPSFDCEWRIPQDREIGELFVFCL